MYAEIDGLHREVQTIAMTPKKPEFDLDGIAHRLKALRIAKFGSQRGSQKEFCKYVEISPTTWNNYESGKSRIELDAAAKLVRKFSITLDWIYMGDPSGLSVKFLTEIQEAESYFSSTKAGEKIQAA